MVSWEVPYILTESWGGGGGGGHLVIIDYLFFKLVGKIFTYFSSRSI